MPSWYAVTIWQGNIQKQVEGTLANDTKEVKQS